MRGRRWVRGIVLAAAGLVAAGARIPVAAAPVAAAPVVAAPVAAEAPAAAPLTAPLAATPLAPAPPAAAPAPARSTAAQAPGVIAGVVRSQSGERVARAQVVVVGTGRAAVTDSAGTFELRGVPAGRVRLEAVAAGYASAVVELVLTPGRATDTAGAAATAPTAAHMVEFVLRPTPLSVPGLVVTGSATAGAALDLVHAATQLRGRALERRVAGSVAETLAGEPGMAVRYNGPGAASPVVRGLTGDRVVVMQDGQRSADLAGSADDHIVTIDPLSAQRIEVIRGPAALLYGNNALGGVVNVLTSDVPTTPPSRAELSFTAQSESAYPGGSGEARSTLPLAGGWALGVRAAGRATGDVRVGRGASSAGDAVFGGRLPNTFARSANGALSLGHGGGRVIGGATLRVFGFSYGLPAPAEDPAAVEVAGRLVSASARAEVATGMAALPMVRLAAGLHDYAHDELEHGAVQMAFGLRTRSGELLARQAAGGARGRLDEGAWGASFTGREYLATGADQLTAPATSRALGVFTFQQLRLGRGGASLQAGGRVDRTSMTSLPDPAFGPGIARSFSALSGSVGLSVPLAPAVTAALSVARSFRAPTVEELFSRGLHAGTAAFEVGVPTLGPERMTGADAVLRIRGARLSGELAAYTSRIADFIAFTTAGDTVIDGVAWPVLTYGQSSARLRGGEAVLEWQAGRAFVLGARGDVVRGTLTGGGAVPFLPPARLSASARWEPGALSAGGAVRHAFAQRRASGGPDVPTAAYTLFDADVGVHFERGGRRHALIVRAANLTNRSYRDAASRIKRFAPNPGRNVALLYRVHL